jgi:hypothetical protein
MRLILLAVLLSSCTLHPGERPGAEVDQLDLCWGEDIGDADCGGDPVGTWFVDGACITDPVADRDAGSEVCATTTVWSVELVDVSGQLWFGPGGSGSRDLQSRALVGSAFSQACLAADAFPGEPAAVSCENRSGGAYGVCEFLDARCECSDEQAWGDQVSFDWWTNGSALTLHHGTGFEETFGYCVDGDRLRIEGPDGRAWTAHR